MNGVMAGMMAVSMPWRHALGDPSPAQPEFWFVMSIALTVGFAVAYPLNWWLVSAGLKHGMTTVGAAPMTGPMPVASTRTKVAMVVVSVAVLVVGVTFAIVLTQ